MKRRPGKPTIARREQKFIRSGLTPLPSRTTKFYTGFGMSVEFRIA
jgi:hypothetical protein